MSKLIDIKAKHLTQNRWDYSCMPIFSLTRLGQEKMRRRRREEKGRRGKRRQTIYQTKAVVDDSKGCEYKSILCLLLPDFHWVGHILPDFTIQSYVNGSICCFYVMKWKIMSAECFTWEFIFYNYETYGCMQSSGRTIREKHFSLANQSTEACNELNQDNPDFSNQ